MANFLQVNKEYFKLGLNPTEILILAQVAEYNRTTGDCFMSDEAFAASFGVSKSTISREMKVLESKGYIIRETKNVKGGKERHIKINLTNIKMSLDSCEKASKEDTQTSNCLLTNVNLPIVNKQNDSIKDNNIKDNLKDNNSGVTQTSFEITPLEPKVEEVGGVNQEAKSSKKYTYSDMTDAEGNFKF